MPDGKHLYEKPRIHDVYVRRESQAPGSSIEFGVCTGVHSPQGNADDWAACVSSGFNNTVRLYKGGFWTDPGDGQWVPVTDERPLTTGEAKELFRALLADHLRLPGGDTERVVDTVAIENTPPVAPPLVNPPATEGVNTGRRSRVASAQAG